MRVEQDSIPATDGFSLASTRYRPDAGAAAPHAVVLINPATGVRRTYYDKYARFLADEGFDVITYDYRGIGDSGPGTGLGRFHATMSDWGEKDVAGAIRWAAAQSPGARLLVVGHSAGGQLVGLAGNAGAASAMLAVAAQSGYWRHWDVRRRYVMALLWYVLIPVLTRLAGYFPSKRLGLGEDLPAGVALEWARWCRHPDYMTTPDGRPLRPHFADFTGPILAYSFSDDGYAPRRAVEALLRFYDRAAVTHRHLTPDEAGARRGVGHFGFFRDQFRDSLWRQSADWLRQRAGRDNAAPSAPRGA